MQIYLPADLYGLVKKHQLPASELLQNAVRAELRRLDLLAKSDTYIAELMSQVGRPTPAEHSRGRAVAERIARRTTRRRAG